MWGLTSFIERFTLCEHGEISQERDCVYSDGFISEGKRMFISKTLISFLVIS